MRNLILSLLIPMAIIWGMRSQIGAVCVFNWLTFMRPHTFTWSFWSTAPVFVIGVVLLFSSTLFHRQGMVTVNGFLRAYLALYFFMLLSMPFAHDAKFSWQHFSSYFLLTPLCFILISKAVSTLKDLRLALYSMNFSIGIVGAKAGFVSFLTGKLHVTQGVNGFVGDNNNLAQCLLLAVGSMVGLLGSISQRWARILAVMLITGSLLMVLVTQSRGAFLTVLIVAFLSILDAKRFLPGLIIIAFLALAIKTFVPADVFSRMETLENVEEDSSAMHRIDMWKRAIDVASKHPIQGVGVGGFVRYAHDTYPPPYLVTHSTYFQVLSTLGYGGLVLYLLVLLIVITRVHRTYAFLKRCNLQQECTWLVTYAFFQRNLYVGYIFGSAFLDMFAFDIPWYHFLYSMIFCDIAMQHVHNSDAVEEASDIGQLHAISALDQKAAP